MVRMVRRVGWLGCNGQDAMIDQSRGKDANRL
jgi:hypothetical protein